MPRPWTTLEQVDTKEGPLELRQRDERDFLITISGRILMNSLAHRSEKVLGEVACRPLTSKAPRVVLGGLGMGFTLRAVLDALPAQAALTVVELNPVVERWCRGPLAHLNDRALEDPRVELVIADVTTHLRSQQARSLDSIILDLYEGPNRATNPSSDPFYGTRALSAFKGLLKAGGTLAVWSEQTDRPFEQRLVKAGFKAETSRPGRGGLKHAVFLGRA